MSYGTWTPRELEDDVTLSLIDEKIISTIQAFEKAGKKCFQTNATLAKKCHCSTRTISRRVQRLIKNGRITAERFDGRKRILRSCCGWATMSQQPGQDDKAAETPCRNNNIVNNTSINIDDICYQQAQNDQEGRPHSVDEVREHCASNGYKVDPAEFFAYYEGNGWMTGPNPVHDWRAVLLTWHYRGERKRKKSSSKANKSTSQSTAAGEPGNSFDTNDFFDAALAKSFGDDYEFGIEK